MVLLIFHILPESLCCMGLLWQPWILTSAVWVAKMQHLHASSPQLEFPIHPANAQLDTGGLNQTTCSWRWTHRRRNGRTKVFRPPRFEGCAVWLPQVCLYSHATSHVCSFQGAMFRLQLDSSRKRGSEIRKQILFAVALIFGTC